MYREKRIGLKTEPCGTLELSDVREEEKSARDLNMRARAVLRNSLRAARRLAGTDLDDLNNKEIFLSSFRLFLLAAMTSVDSLGWE